MLHDRLANVLTVARKELGGFFASPAAYLFIGAFLAVTLFIFFWVETFFARNLADVRPLFQWMPVLLIFLVAALTMRAWAEERRSGTLELLLTAPVSPSALVLGKFVGALGLVAIALALTLPLPITVAFLGPLDWGPVIGGYVAALALASAYVAIGLTVSSRTDNQIVSLIVTALICGAFYLIGSPALTELFGYRVGEVLRALGAGSRFESITRGVLDVRDLYFYLSITAVFLVANRWSIERLRRAGNPRSPGQRRWNTVAALAVLNLLAANLWLGALGGARVDLTQGHLYTLSDATKHYLTQVQEPLLIRGYFSAHTHPLLAPLVPQLRDLLEEYAQAGGEKVRVEFIDPQADPALEEEAASKYGIKPVPFQTANKYQASVVNSYFDVLVAYGDQYQVLGFRDLIDVKSAGEGDLHIALKNPEYDITRAIRKVMAGWQSGGSTFAALPKPLVLTAYLSTEMPEALTAGRKALEEAMAKLDKSAADKLSVQIKDPGADPALAQRLTQEGLRPLVVALDDPQSVWFHLQLSDGKRVENVRLPRTLEAGTFEHAIQAAAKRFAPGFLKTVAVVTPSVAGPGAPRFDELREALGESVHWQDTTLDAGVVPPEADLLLLLGPQGFNERQRFAVDQFLMQGGTVVVATSPARIAIGQEGIQAMPASSGLKGWLAGYGIKVGSQLVLDTQAGALPIPVSRQLGNGIVVRELKLTAYPYIIDVRGKGLNAAQPVTASLGQLSVPWAAAIEVDAGKNKQRSVTTLLTSSPHSWTSDAVSVLPDYLRYPQLGFAQGKDQAARPLAVAIEGRFDSAFEGKRSPLVAAAASAPSAAASKPQGAASAPHAAASAPDGDLAASRVIEHSPASARLVVIGSVELFSDQANRLVGQALGTKYDKPAEFAQNLIDWSLEDPALLTIRSRNRYARTLEPMSASTQAGWEYGNYGMALAGLLMVGFVQRTRRSKTARRHERLLEEAQ